MWKERFAALGKAGIMVNGDMGPDEVQKQDALNDDGKNLMCAAVRQMDRATPQVVPDIGA